MATYALTDVAPCPVCEGRGLVWSWEAGRPRPDPRQQPPRHCPSCIQELIPVLHRVSG